MNNFAITKIYFQNLNLIEPFQTIKWLKKVVQVSTLIWVKIDSPKSIIDAIKSKSMKPLNFLNQKVSVTFKPNFNH